MKRSASVACAWLVLAVPVCFGQSPMDGVAASVFAGPEPGKYEISFTVSAPPLPRTILTGRPYSGDEVSRQTRTLADGTRTVQPGPSAVKYRDSSGRIRTERRALRPMGMINWIDPPIVPEIVDPVAGFVYYLDPVNRVAHRTVLTPESFRIVDAPPDANYPASVRREKDLVRTVEPLGTDVIGGIEVQGSRITTTYAVDSLGDDSPLKAILEIWTSPELGLTVLSKNSDPRTGEFTNEVLNIRRGEPDPDLFRVPPGYRIVDEPVLPFTFTVSGPAAAKR